MNQNRNGAARALKVGIFARLSPETAHNIEAMRGRAQARERAAFLHARMKRVKGDATLNILADAAIAACPAFGGGDK